MKIRFMLNPSKWTQSKCLSNAKDYFAKATDKYSIGSCGPGLFRLPTSDCADNGEENAQVESYLRKPVRRATIAEWSRPLWADPSVDHSAATGVSLPGAAPVIPGDRKRATTEIASTPAIFPGPSLQVAGGQASDVMFRAYQFDLLARTSPSASTILQVDVHHFRQ